MIDARIRKRFQASKDSSAFELDIHLKAASPVTVLFGPSGAGKTLALDAIAGDFGDALEIIGDKRRTPAMAGVQVEFVGSLIEGQQMVPQIFKVPVELGGDAKRLGRDAPSRVLLGVRCPLGIPEDRVDRGALVDLERNLPRRYQVFLGAAALDAYFEGH